MPGFNSKAPSANSEYDLVFGGDMFNDSGDIEDLFSEFDDLVIEVKENLVKNHIKYNDLPRNIDFNKKYYSFPVEFTATNKAQ